MSERPIRVLLVDDDPMVVRGLRMMLEHGSEGAISVVGTAADGTEVVPAVQAHYPDVVLMDIRMPRKDGISATREVAALPDSPRVIVLTTFDGDDEPIRAAHAGAVGFLLKTESPEDVIAAVRAVASGEGAVSKRTAKQLLAHIADADASGARREARRLVGTLTEREQDVARGVARGLTNKEIAAELFVSEGTVKAHLGSVQEKLQVDNRVLVAVLVTQAG
ncbi:response regulator [Ornithinimicrobium sp. Y1694]|uniref:response regulator n=1 Tax=Ornithinimicrobium sp. Y1694 TaxID=3418590 RepID=UPI003CEF4BDF